MIDIIIEEMTGSFSEVPVSIATARLMAALILGGIIGLEREWRQKAPGQEGHM